MSTRRERLEARLEKRQQWADKREQEAAARFAGVRKIADAIPFGQPILVGHHSERHARADQRRIHNGMRAGVEALNMAEHHTSKAGGIADQLDKSIFSDDPDATECLQERIAELKAQRDAMKASNSAYRKGPAAWAAHMGISADREAELRDAVVNGYSWCKQPHPAYELTNLGGNIRRLEKRLAEVADRVERTAKAEQSGILIEGADYVRITFPDKPARDVLNDLRGAGFRWSGGCWCGYRSAIPASVHELHNEAENCDESI